MSQRRVEDFFADGDEYEDVLSEALEKAQSGFDIDFVADLKLRWEQYGMHGFLSQRQYEILCRISGLED